ncbi:MAG TPA: hypothetical protein VM307_15370 [Egibacteraceae bacterium]|nr:hypothetical protein [Egibacteraceae bacterium]
MTRLLAAVALLAMTACAGSPAAPAALPACGHPPSPAAQPPPDGALLPPGTTLQAVRDQGARVQINAYTQSTPDGVEQWIHDRDDLEVDAVHRDGHQTELLVTGGTWRTYVSVRGVCADGSLMAQVIAPADADVALPQPGQKGNGS